MDFMDGVDVENVHRSSAVATVAAVRCRQRGARSLLMIVALNSIQNFKS